MGYRVPPFMSGAFSEARPPADAASGTHAAWPTHDAAPGDDASGDDAATRGWGPLAGQVEPVGPLGWGVPKIIGFS